MIGKPNHKSYNILSRLKGELLSPWLNPLSNGHLGYLDQAKGNWQEWFRVGISGENQREALREFNKGFNTLARSLKTLMVMLSNITHFMEKMYPIYFFLGNLK